MENLNLILFISIVTPLLMMVFVAKGRARRILLFLVLGIFVCLFSSEFSGILFEILPQSVTFLTINVTPFTEEILKAIPILIFVFGFKPNDQQIYEASIAVGVGFAILENAFILASNIEYVSIPLALIRGFGAGMMHGLTTFVLGYALSKFRTNKKLSYTGTVAMLLVSILYHSLYNTLVQSRFEVIGFILPILTFTPFLIILKKKKLI